MPVITSDRAESATKFIAVSDAVKRGLGSRATINRYISNGFVRSTYVSGRRYASLGDLEDMARLREEGMMPVLDTGVEVTRIANRLAALMPILDDSQKQQLVSLLSDSDDEGSVADDA